MNTYHISYGSDAGKAGEKQTWDWRSVGLSLTSPNLSNPLFALACREPNRPYFVVLGLVGANSYAVPQAARGSVRKKTP
jgi:hypothetical protein